MALLNRIVFLLVDVGEAEGQDGNADETLLSGRQRNGRKRFVCRLSVSYAQRNQDFTQLTEVVVENYLKFIWILSEIANFGHMISGYEPDHSERLFQNVAVTFVKYKLRYFVDELLY